MAEVQAKKSEKGSDAVRTKAGHEQFCFEERASCCSRMFLGWFTTIILNSKKKVLEEEDIGTLNRCDECEYMQEKLMVLWNDEVKRNGLEKASLWQVYLRFIGYDTLFVLIVLSVVEAASQLLTPLLARQLLTYLEGNNPLESLSLVFITLGLSLAPVLAGFCRGRIIFMSKRAALKSYGALTTAVYRKALRLSASGKADAETGQILNIMSADANNSQERAILMLLPVIVGPFHIAICLWLIAMTIGWAMAFAFVFLLVVTPININTFKNVAKWIREATKRADKRVKLVNELISGIRIIKFYAWEKPFLKMIEKARAYEMDAIARHAYWVQIGMMAAFQSMPQLLQLCVFAAFYYLGGEFKASTVFVTIQLFDVLRIPVAQMPNGLSQVAQLHVALRRIKRFLKREEVVVSSEDTFNNSGKTIDDSPCIVVNSGSFAWRLMEKDKDEAVKGDETSKPQVDNSQNLTSKIEMWKMSNINLTISPGQLVMVAGSVGSGKSSLLRVFLNEIIVFLIKNCF